MDPKIQDLVEEYFKRPLTPEEGQRLSEWLSNSPEETQRFAQRMEVLNAQAGPTSPAGDVRFKDLGASKKASPWARTAFWIFLPLLAFFLYWRSTSPLVPERSPQINSSQAPPAPVPTPSPVKVFQAKRSLPPPQISTPIPFKGDPRSQAPEAPSKP